MDIELDNKEFQDVWRLVSGTNSSVFMTGRAGTGKSTFLRYIVENVPKKTVVLAPTGIAAVNAGGMTLHSFFKIPLHPYVSSDTNFDSSSKVRAMQKFTKDKIKLINEAELIVIDEVSMVRADVLDFVDLILRTFVHNGGKRPFGGKQILLVGDAFQLEPVTTRQDWDILRREYETPYFFGAKAFRRMELVQIELRKVYRQKEAEFLNILDKVRVGCSTPDDIATLNTRVFPFFEPRGPQMFITLTSTRADSDHINDRHLAELATDPFNYVGVVEGDFPESSLPTNKLLTLKAGAQVVFIRNDQERRWYNGTVGRVTALHEDGVFVEVESQDDAGQPITIQHFVERELWENVRYRYDDEKDKVVSDVLGTYCQLPLKLAWALTIHKSQGLTFDNVIIDLGRGSFACGQTYVALSRCRTLEGIILRKPLIAADIQTSQFVLTFSNGANNRELIESQIGKAQAQNLASEARDAMARKDYRRAVALLFDSLAHDPETLKSEVVRRYVSGQIMRTIGQLEAQVLTLAENERKIKKKSFDFAKEYYLMAVDCYNSYSDPISAKANINKAIALVADYADALIFRSRIEIEGGDYEHAVRDADAALRSLKEERKAATKRDVKREELIFDVIALRARARMGLGHWELAFDDLCTVISSHKMPDVETLNLMVKVCRKMGRTDEADMYSRIARRIENGDDEEEDD